MKVTPHVSTGNGMDFLVGRVSYTFGLQARLLLCHTLAVVEVELQGASQGALQASVYCCTESDSVHSARRGVGTSQGPCISTHTACSSSLVAAHLAASALDGPECDAALAAGVFLVLLQGTMAGICQLQVPAWPPMLKLCLAFRNLNAKIMTLSHCDANEMKHAISPASNLR